MWEVSLKKTAVKDSEKVRQAGLRSKVDEILDILEKDPYGIPPRCEKLVGELSGLFSRRITNKHRLVYEVVPESREIIVYRMFSHYGE
ncbi:MAG: Txe/YoeB family addiction module toxin [Verrucomicrobiales bacterium]